AELGLAEPEQLREAVALASEAGDPERVRSLLERAVVVAREQARVGEEIWAAGALADIYEREQQPERALAVLGDTIANAPPAEGFELKLRLATLAHEELGDLERAARVYEELLDFAPTDARVFKPLFDVYRRTGRQ